MRKVNKHIIFLLLIFMFTAGLFFIWNNNARAATPGNYYFLFNGVKSSNYQVKNPNVMITLTSDSWDSSAVVTWESTETNVIKIESTTYGSNIVKLVRKGPGYATINAVVKVGSNTYTVSCDITVDLLIDFQNTPGVITDTYTQKKVLVLNSLNETSNVHLKYIDYLSDDNTSTVSGSAILASLASYDSDNNGVVTVDSSGKITPVGAGSANITITSNTMSNTEKTQSVTLRVVVKPTFSMDYYDIDGTHKVENSVSDVNVNDPAERVPSDFTIVSNASKATILHWKVVDLSTGNELPQSGTKLTYTIGNTSNSLTFSNVKAGTYGIYAFADDDFSVENSVPYAYKMLVAPVNIEKQNIIMNVGDTFSILDNSNIPDGDTFSYNYETGTTSIATIDEATDTITAQKSGQIKLRPVLSGSLSSTYYKLDSNTYITVTIVDGIALNMANATLYKKGTLPLQANVSDRSIPVIWSSDKPSVASVTSPGGLVTANNTGTAVITAQQTINGVVKKATCKITVEDSVSGITLTPSSAILGINGFVTIHATVSPDTLSGVTLYWKSSDDSIVKISEYSSLTATVQGLKSGTAVISAINQDNVVVGYCSVTVQEPVLGITLSQTSVTMKLSDKTLQLKATVEPNNATDTKINWDTTDSTIAKVDANGLVTLLKSGTVSIIATSDDNPKKYAICNITIQVPVTSVTLDEKSITMYKGEKQKLTCTVLPINASINTVAWSSSDTSVASVDTSGKVTAIKTGSTVITVKTTDGSYTASCTVTVKTATTGIKLSVTDLQLKVGDIYSLTATLVPADSSDNSLIWLSSNTSVVTVDNNGKITAKASGTANITVKTKGGAASYCKVTVNQSVKGLILNYNKKTIYKNGIFQLRASITPSDATVSNLTWTSSASKIAKVSKTGEVTGLAGGTAIITCSTEDNGYSASCVVTVNEMVTSIKLNHSSYRISKGKTVILTAKASSKTATNTKVKWASSNKKIAVVNKQGKVTGVSYGTATITATTTDGGDAQASCTISVVVPATRVKISKSSLVMFTGDNKDLNATVLPKGATYHSVKWSTSDNTVATVDEDGLVTAISAGTARITAETKDNSGKKAYCHVIVNTSVPATAVTVMNKKLVMVPGESKTVSVSLTPSTATDKVTWSTDNASVASVNNRTGRITARSTGTATITVMTASGKTASIDISVIGLNMTELTLEQYTTYSYALSVDGTSSSVIFTIDNPQIAVLQKSGSTSVYISSRAAGTATITANVNGRKLRCRIKVIGI